MQTGWWKAPDATYGWGSYFSDFLTMQTCFNWMMGNTDWKKVLLYLAQYDLTGTVLYIKEGLNTNRISTTHFYILINSSG
ncbi:MAG: hypothetical protein NC929_02985 [Candidatus Omnitrophica bacterium]|nr:hypothetical protein [Candidatus Omnitrophota bacterium]